MTRTRPSLVCDCLCTGQTDQKNGANLGQSCKKLRPTFCRPLTWFQLSALRAIFSKLAFRACEENASLFRPTLCRGSNLFPFRSKTAAAMLALRKQHLLVHYAINPNLADGCLYS